VRKLCIGGHPNIVQAVLRLGQPKPDSSLYFIDMELCEVTLEQYARGTEVPYLPNWARIRRREEGMPDVVVEARFIIESIANGLEFIHNQGEVHRDLSLQNGANPTSDIDLTLVLFALESRQWIWKIADVGITTQGTSNRLMSTRSSRGKPCYRAPELLSENAVYNNSGHWVVSSTSY